MDDSRNQEMYAMVSGWGNAKLADLDKMGGVAVNRCFVIMEHSPLQKYLQIWVQSHVTILKISNQIYK